MKRYTLFIYAALLSIIGTLPMNAQQTQDALYIYRNDGGFMGFFYSDIDACVFVGFYSCRKRFLP